MNKKNLTEDKIKELKIMNPDLCFEDDLHFQWSPVLSYNKLWNFVIGSRCSGKTVASWLLLWRAFTYGGRPSIVLRRKIVDITTTYIDDVEKVLNKFLSRRVKLIYKKGDIKQGILDIKLGEWGKEYTYGQIGTMPVFFRVIALSNPMSRIKSLMLANVKYFFMDEFIVNMKANETYLKDEFFMVNEIYNTYVREAKTPIRILCAANPYSVYCPFFNSLGVDTAKLKPGAFVVGPNYVINCFEPSEELKAQILATNPQYKHNEEYKRYGFGGQAILDRNIRLCKFEPKGFRLKFVLKMGSDYISLHKASESSNLDAKWWVCKHNSTWESHLSKNRKVMVFNFRDMDHMCEMPDIATLQMFNSFTDSIRKNAVVYNCIDAKYMTEDIYPFIN